MGKKTVSRIIISILFFFVFVTVVVSLTSQDDTIQLIGNPSTGYSWCIEDFDSEIFDVREDVAYLGDVGVVGADSLYLYRFKGLKKGEGRIRFSYKRPWLEEVEKTRLYKVKVNRKLKVKIREIEE